MEKREEFFFRKQRRLPRWKVKRLGEYYRKKDDTTNNQLISLPFSLSPFIFPSPSLFLSFSNFPCLSLRSPFLFSSALSLSLFLPSPRPLSHSCFRFCLPLLLTSQSVYRPSSFPFLSIRSFLPLLLFLLSFLPPSLLSISLSISLTLPSLSLSPYSSLSFSNLPSLSSLSLVLFTLPFTLSVLLLLFSSPNQYFNLLLNISFSYFSFDPLLNP